MENRKRLSPEESSRSEPSYLELQAYVGTTKHMGGLEATEELVELCRINKDTYVLDVGCGAGATPCYIAKRYGCRVVGVDVSEKMIDWSNKRARRESVEDRVEFRVADAQNVAFEDALFDVVIGESVITFIEEKQRAVSEYVRVVKPDGYVGLNEETLIKAPLPAELIQYVKRTWDIESEIPTSDGWVRLLQGAGLRDLVVRPYEFSARRESSQIKRYGFEDYWRMLYRTLSISVRSPAFRSYMKETRYLPKNLFEYLGYGIYVGRK